MPNRYHTKFSQSKISAKGARPGQSAGSTPGITVKPAQPKHSLPGKAANGHAVHYRKVQIYPKSEGL